MMGAEEERAATTETVTAAEDGNNKSNTANAETRNSHHGQQEQQQQQHNTTSCLSSSLHLTRLLFLAAPLHQRYNHDGEASSLRTTGSGLSVSNNGHYQQQQQQQRQQLSLSQLVDVHTSLCRAAAMSTVDPEHNVKDGIAITTTRPRMDATRTTTTTTSAASLLLNRILSTTSTTEDARLSILATSEDDDDDDEHRNKNDFQTEVQVAIDIFHNKQGTNDARRLLLLQYLMYCAMRDDHTDDDDDAALVALATIVVPYLQFCQQQQQQRFSLDFMESLLDAVFSVARNDNNAGDDGLFVQTKSKTQETVWCADERTTTRADDDRDTTTPREHQKEEKDDHKRSSSSSSSSFARNKTWLQASLDALLLLTSGNEENDTTRTSSLQLARINDNDDNVQQWTTTVQCRVLVRLFHYLDTNNHCTDDSDDAMLFREMTYNAIHTLAKQGIQRCLTLATASAMAAAAKASTRIALDDDNDDNYRALSFLLHPIVTWLLPVLCDSTTTGMQNESCNGSTAVHDLWSSLCLALVVAKSNTDNDDDNDNHGNDNNRNSTSDCSPRSVPTPMINPKVALVVSTVSCSILPSLLLQQQQQQQQLATASSTSNKAASSLSDNDSCVILWNLILYSLQQGMNGSASSSSLKHGNNGGFQKSKAVLSMDQMLRRRGLYLLRLLVEQEQQAQQQRQRQSGDGALPSKSKKNNRKSKGSKNKSLPPQQPQLLIWRKYVLCFEALEMETEPHLVDQVWETVAEICVAAALPESATTLSFVPPKMTWEWASAMLARVFLSDTPAVRKLGLYRLLSGHAGIDVVLAKESKTDKNDDHDSSASASVFQLAQKKHAIKSKRKNASGTSSPSLASIDIVSTDFVLNTIIPSYDSLGQSVGTNMQFEEDGRIQTQDVAPLFSSFLGAYMSSLSIQRRRDFLKGFFARSIVCDLRLKSTVMVYEAIANASNADLPIDQELLETAVESLGSLFSSRSIVVAFRERLLVALATILSRSSTTDTINPELLLKLLSFYPAETTPQECSVDDDGCDLLLRDPKYVSLQKWLSKLGNSSPWAASVGAACASSFVMGQLIPPTSDWIPEYGDSETECAMGGAVVLLCSLTALSVESNAGERLWPAIHKGLATVPQGYPWHNANRTCRSLLLLENGCRLGVTSGIGNGDLVVDKHQTMMPPPPNIEQLLSNAVDFDLLHIEALTSFKGEAGASKWGGARSGNATRVSLTFANLISQVQVLCSAYPSSLSVSTAGDRMLKRSMEELSKKGLSAIGIVQNMALAFGALSCGADPNGVPSTAKSCSLVLHLEFRGNVDGTVSNVQTARSIFQYAKWGTMSYLLKAFLDSKDVEQEDRLQLLDDLFETAEDAVHATPADALLPLFDCVVSGARKCLSTEKHRNDATDSVYTENLTKIIAALFAMKSEVITGRPSIYMLNEICALLFRSELLMDEYERLLRQGRDASMPIREAFRRLIEMAGTKRNHVSKIAVSYMSSAWCGSSSQGDRPSSVSDGLAAIPYREDIFDLLLHKEERLDESTSIQETDIVFGTDELSLKTDETSVSRGFVLMFLSRLPDVNEGLPSATLSELLQFIMFRLLDDVCLVTNKAGGLPLGTPEYSRKMRAWQALCILSRYVTNDIADSVCDKVFACMGQNLHGQIRYFLEGFTIQCARMHPAIFGRKLVKEIRRKELSLQHIATLMIASGNLLVGRYTDDFFRQFDSTAESVVDLKQILAGVIPWLSSTQGFSRAIAQLLVHKLIPMVVSVNDDSDDQPLSAGTQDSDWFLRSIYAFLDENPEMKRLRKKQAKFFETYDVDDTCRVETLLQLEVDEGFEATPTHMVDAMKKCLEQVYLEAHEHETPQWKQVAQLMKQTDDEDDNDKSQVQNDDDEAALLNFQRKIIPLDSLELNLAASRELRLKNALGRKKQHLVVCASLVDKIPNLAGLARTCEIFAAQRLVIPDTSVCRMDNFKSISVSAGEWIDIEGCKEDELLSWLRLQKEQGYTIVGVEQTMSSTCLSNHVFSKKTVLLLGKEKEGIPVNLLQVVDVCVEIPQLGVIRSLNVHVTGALAIWEYTKQMMLLE